MKLFFHISKISHFNCKYDEVELYQFIFLEKCFSGYVLDENIIRMEHNLTLLVFLQL